jgi:GNAT superfamily N-acetyltransferase
MERAAGPISISSGPQARLAGPDDSPGFHNALADAFSLPIADVIASMPADIVDIEGCDVWVVNEGEKVAGCGVFLRDGDRIGVYSMATTGAHQRKGIGRATLNTAMAYYQDRGAVRFTLGATELGFPLYEKVGFKTVSQPHVFVLGNSTQFS